MTLNEFAGRTVVDWSEEREESGSPGGFRRFEFSDDKSNKFWEIKLEGTSFTVRYGRIGTEGVSQTKGFPAPDKAQKEFDKLIKEKTGKGYEEVESADDEGGGDDSASDGSPLRSDCSYYIGLTYDEAAEGTEWGGRLDELLERKGVENVYGLLAGQWIAAGDDEDTSVVVEALVNASERLKGIRALFIGDIEQEESEISWINQSDLSPLFNAFPNLEYFGVRGGNGLSLGSINHSKLKSLRVESGGLPISVVREVINSNLPELEELVLWLGTDDYGFDGTIDDIRPLLENNPFPKLKHLGLMNSILADQIAEALKGAPILQRIEVLDLSMGTLGDEGAQALLDNPDIRKLKKLDLHYHFMSQEMMEQMKSIGIPVDVSDQQEPDDYDGESHRYVSVGE